MFSTGRIGSKLGRAIKRLSQQEGTSLSTHRRICNIARRTLHCEMSEETDLREQKETRRRQQAESSIFSSRYVQNNNLATASKSSPLHGNDSDINTNRKTPDALARMADALAQMGSCSLRSHRLMGSSLHMQWNNVLYDVKEHTNDMSMRSKGLLALSTLGCGLVGMSNILGNNSWLPNILQAVGESIKTGKSSIDTIFVENPKVRFQVAKELYMNSINQVSRAIEQMQSCVEQTTQNLQQLEEKRAQEVQSIISGRG